MDILILDDVDSIRDELDYIPDETNRTMAYSYYDAEQSSFEEATGICSNKDDPQMPYLTIKSFTIGLMFVIGRSFIYIWNFTVSAVPLIHPMLVILALRVLGKFWSWIP